MTDGTGLAALRPEWSALFDACPDASPFQSPEWLFPWFCHFAGERLWVLAIRRAGRLVGLAPFFLHVEPRSCRRQVTLLGNGVSDRLNLLAVPDQGEAVASAVFDHLVRRAEQWDSCDLRDLPEASPLLHAPLAVMADDHVEPEEPCPVARLPRTAEQVLGTLPRRMRSDLRRRARRAAELGTLRYETADAANRAEYLAALLRLHAARWRARGQAGVLDGTVLAAFHDEVTNGLLKRGLLRLHVLRLGGQIIAAQYAMHHRDRGYSYIGGFDPRFAGLGPGALLIARTLERAVQDGAAEFDFLRGRERYKYGWGAADRPQFRRQIRK